MFVKPSRNQMSLTTTQNDFVVDVGDVHDVGDIERKVIFKNASNDVKREVGTGVAQMSGIVHRRSTNVKLDMVLFHRQQFRSCVR